MHIHNLKKLKDLRKNLRQNLTRAEAVLWKALQRRQLEEENSEDSIVLGIS
jgi:very-short-patch-repair endonuclease